MSGFNNPILGGGGTLAYPAIKSPNFVDSVSGWDISKDGSAEFNNLEIRGTFLGANFILNNSGFFLYSPSAGFGNLVISIAVAAGTDQFLNAYPEGIGIDDQISAINSGILNLSSATAGGGDTACVVTIYSALGGGNGAQVIISHVESPSPAITPGVLLELQGRLGLANQGSDPAQPTGGGILYCKGGALKYRGTSGTITTVANP